MDEAVVEERLAVLEYATAYRIYTAWADDAGIKRLLSRKSFTQRMEDHGIAAGKSRGVRCLFGIRERLASDVEDAK